MALRFKGVICRPRTPKRGASTSGHRLRPNPTLNTILARDPLVHSWIRVGTDPKSLAPAAAMLNFAGSPGQAQNAALSVLGYLRHFP